MAEFCPKCFIKLNPEFSRSDLKIVKEITLCEGCGEIVPKIVIGITEYALYYRKNQNNFVFTIYFWKNIWYNNT